MNSNDLFSPVYNNAFRELEKGDYNEFMFYGGGFGKIVCNIFDDYLPTFDQSRCTRFMFKEKR